ncbi:MAG TPA: alpha/beta fold hydrolase [Dongiaceae bacterium]|nr:alpha/beta fold hydrolase [Dongiaceae bacterium]
MRSPFELNGPSQPPASGGKPRHLVILLHGYGSDGNDLIGLAPHWARILPDSEFLSPHAPFPCEMGPFGHQWFSFADRLPETILAGTRAAASILNAFLDEALATRGLTDRDLALVGFSQGTMMALYVALRRPEAVAAVVGYSGTLVGASDLAAEIRSRPPVLLVHGDADPVVPYEELARAAAALKAEGVEVTTETRRGMPHSIDERGLLLGGQFIARAFAAVAPAVRVK